MTVAYVFLGDPRRRGVSNRIAPSARVVCRLRSRSLPDVPGAYLTSCVHPEPVRWFENQVYHIPVPAAYLGYNRQLVGAYKLNGAVQVQCARPARVRPCRLGYGRRYAQAGASH